MNILLSFLQDTTVQPHPVPAYRFWSYYIKNGITEAGMQFHEVQGADWAEGLMYANDPAKCEAWKASTWQRTLAYVKNKMHEIDLFLCYLYPHQIDVNAIQAIRKLGIPCVNFFCDNIREFRQVPEEFKIFDCVWVPEFEALDMYQKAGVKFINLPMPMWVEKKYREINALVEIDQLSFIGSKDALRQQLLYEVIQKQMPVIIRGSGWETGGENADYSTLNRGVLQNQVAFVKNNGFSGLAIKLWQKARPIKTPAIASEYILPMPDFDLYIDITRRSAVTLGINRVPTFKRPYTSPLVYSRLRDIEAPMLGASYLTEYCAGVKQLYNVETEVFTYKNTDELCEKANELLRNPKLRRQLRVNGQQRALNDYGIPASLVKLRHLIY